LKLSRFSYQIGWALARASDLQFSHWDTLGQNSITCQSLGKELFPYLNEAPACALTKIRKCLIQMFEKGEK
jgi:hypothetical protein